MFSNCGRIDAPGSHFSNVGHDQHNVGHDQYIDQRIYFNVAETASHETVRRALRSFPQQLPISSSVAVFASHHNRTPSDLASNLIGEIIRSLVDLTEFSVNYSYLQDLLLKPLHRTLFLTGYALQLYEDTPLGPNLAALISPEVEKCCLLFQNILDDIDRYRSTLHSTHIPASRLPALWSKSKVHELAWKLCHRQRQLGQFLVALNSITWENFGHHLRAGPVSLREFRTFFSKGPASLRDIQITNIKVLDHLGQNISVPLMFCSSWKQFDYVIKGYCRERPGYLLVNQGDYQIIRAKDNKAVDPSEFPNVVGPGVKLEMSIVMQQTLANQTRCPRCHYVNSRLAEHMGWIECRECSGLFRIEAAHQEDQSEDSNKERDRKVDEGHSGKVHASGESHDPGIVSPAVQTRGSSTSTTEKRGLDDGGARDTCLNDDVKLFRRIHLICMDIDIPGSSNGHTNKLPEWVTKYNATIGPVSDPRETDLVILVMGPTGVGKSTFINNPIGQAVMTVSYDLQSCTSENEHVIVPHPDDPTRRIVLVDTIGFDDTYVDDVHILRLIAVWLARSYSDGMKLAGFIYLHEIFQTRMFGTSRKNLTMFNKLCGDDALKNVVLATTKWSDIPEDVGWRREQQLSNTYWKRMLNLGSRMARFTCTRESAWAIVNSIISNDPVNGHVELVDLQITLPETEAGTSLCYTLEELVEMQREMARQLREENRAQGLSRQLQSTLHQTRELKAPGKRILSFLFSSKESRR